MLAEKLNMTPEAAEKWIVNLIRNARLDAKIDSKEGHVVMGTQAASVQQQVIEKTKSTLQKTQTLMINMEKRLSSTKTFQEPFALKMKDNEPLIIDRDADATPRPFCCCLDVRVGTVLIGLFYLVIHSAMVIVAFESSIHHKNKHHYNYFHTHRMEGDNYVGMCLATFFFLVTVMLIFGALMRKPGMILPFFAIQVIDIVVFIMGSARAVSFAPEMKARLESFPNFRYRDAVRQMSLNSFILVLIVVGLMIVLFKAYLMRCVWECYCFAQRQVNHKEKIFHHPYPIMEHEPILPNYDEAIKMPKEMPPPYQQY
eukprot:Seg1512.4 transcript_id=Seg1512.4/GoldUCD/mRNA.D3Y31 product="Lysosomal-associated transmembrane protein 4A" protein_id=Seg1512.4/GoldUCD/D3Y31